MEGTILAFGGLFAALAWRLRRTMRWTPKAGRAVALPRGYRWQVLARVLSAIVGGYAFSSVGATLLARTLAFSGMTSPAFGVATASMLSFLIFTLTALWVFAAPRAWLWLLLASGSLALLVWLLERA
ncbi:hypothetical protein [Bordetella holmesii]|uniref:Membrane protein n=2 Tax=Bordetella holmesii TaxID=35814 RepID=A0ABN0S013_9BORD|nr:hypothetical protein [Bordetella holmesii]AHV93163.1 putative membrane protein [Bordetella holmesii ATCC 51541]AIT25050.1 putative membrane protein [Bordetella holmesii 44057]EWM48658.1 putative membrane protein [Bordetella holmesii 41130]EWM49736.1 putative membrane protein [Bordetella holmesii 35009]AMD44300.1 hypothetical protein H558_01620 [Bordetella holmesii H558]